MQWCTHGQQCQKVVSMMSSYVHLQRSKKLVLEFLSDQALPDSSCGMFSIRLNLWGGGLPTEKLHLCTLCIPAVCSRVFSKIYNISVHVNHYTSVKYRCLHLLLCVNSCCVPGTSSLVLYTKCQPSTQLHAVLGGGILSDELPWNQLTHVEHQVQVV